VTWVAMAAASGRVYSLSSLVESKGKITFTRSPEAVFGPRPWAGALLPVTAGMPFRTAQRSVALYQQFGLTTLAQRKQAVRGEHRSVTGKIRKATDCSLQKPHRSLAAPYR
jgi:hypothetical protein